MEEKLIVKFIMFADGERYPLLIQSDGKPHWYATLYTTTQIRNASKAPNTMAAVLAAIRVLYSWLYSVGHDLEVRFFEKKYFNEQELESLRCYVQLKSDDLNNSNLKNSRRRVESIRAVIKPNENRISSATEYIRLSYIADYLEWLAIRLVEQSAKQVDAGALKLIQRMIESLRARRPQKSVRSRETARKGLTVKQQEVLLDLVTPGSQKNPFSPELQTRNNLIVQLLYHLGLRAGELLSLKVSDFDFQENTVLIARRHDNPDDPRINQPVVKTIDRRIPLSEPLMQAVSEYVMVDRHRLRAAKRHNYLFVVHQIGPFLGQPLSSKGLDKLFRELKNVDIQMFKSLTPHVLRHTANEKFSALMDKRGTSPAEEDKLRSYIMGWKEGSGTAGTYTRRHIENKAREAALLLQPMNDGGCDV